MATIFTRLINGEIPCHKIAENDEFFAFLDINPVATGHTLVVPKQETDYLFDLDDELLGRMMVFAKNVAKALHTAVPSERIGLTVIGMEVPHAHIHLVPIRQESDIYFGKEKKLVTTEELAQTAETIRKAYK